MRRLFMICLSTAALAACSGTGDFGTAGSSSTGTGTGTGTTTKTTLSLGSGVGAAFQSGVIAISTKSLSAGGSSSLQVSIVDQTGALYTTSTQITFSSPCQSQGLAEIIATPASGSTPASPSVTTTTGSASATYVAQGCSGTDEITAQATANSQSLSATGSVTVAQAAIGSIAFISAKPASISLKGVGSAGGSATSTLIFQVLDTSGGPRAGATVDFSLNTTVGGMSILPTSAVSDANGQVQTIVNAGTVATTVRVTASTVANGTTISTESNALTVSTGIPTSANISLAVKCQNVEAWNIDGVTVPVTVYMTDRFSNPVPDGTTANFQTTLGGIQASCQTGIPTSGSGSCSVNWTSKAPRVVNGNPATTKGTAYTNAGICAAGFCNGTTNGRSPIIVTAIGEESFKDANGSGYFNPADTVAWDSSDADNDFTSGAMSGQPKPWQDTSEPFLNEFEIVDTYNTPTFIAGEPFLDFNDNGKRDGPDGLVESALCQGPLCNTSSASVAISASNVIVMSGSDPYFSPAVGSTFALGKSGGSVTIFIQDVNGQQMPAGTTVSAVLASTAGSINGPTSFSWPCTSARGPFGFTWAISAPATGPGSGSFILTVTTPGGIVTTAFYNITE